MMETTKTDTLHTPEGWNKPRLPRIALRKSGGKLDDIVVEGNLEIIHIEDLGSDWWIGIYFKNKEFIYFNIHKKDGELMVTDYPKSEWEDWDTGKINGRR